MAEETTVNDLKLKVALLEQTTVNQAKIIEKQDTLLMGMISTVQDLKTKFYLLGVLFPSVVSLLGLLKAFGVFGK